MGHSILQRRQTHSRGTGLTDRAAAQRRLTTRLYQGTSTEFAAREQKPVRIEELFAALEEHNLSNRKGRPRKLPGRWRHLGPQFGAMLAVNLTTTTKYATTFASDSRRGRRTRP